MPQANQTQVPAWRDHIDVLHDAAQLASRIAQLGAQISADFAGRDLTVVAVLKGSYPFFADLARHIDLPLTCEFIGVSSYGASKSTTGVVKLTQDLAQPIAGRDVLIVEDIIDSGLTMQYLLENFSARGPRSVSVCTLLHKPSGARVKVPVRYCGFEIGPQFVVGYGLDYDGRLRNLPYIGVVRDGCEPALKAGIAQAIGKTSPEANHASL